MRFWEKQEALDKRLLDCFANIIECNLYICPAFADIERTSSPKAPFYHDCISLQICKYCNNRYCNYHMQRHGYEWLENEQRHEVLSRRSRAVAFYSDNEDEDEYIRCDENMPAEPDPDESSSE
jgi:hypothetical protein